MSQSGVLTVNTSGKSVTETLTGNSGGAIAPDASHNINILGNNSSGINIVGNAATNTLTVTAYQATTSQEGTVTLATDAQAIAGTDTANALTSSNLAAKLGTQIAHSLAVFEGTSSAITALGVATNGQIPIGSFGADPVLATLTAGTGIAISNNPGAITISLTGTGFAWSDQSGSFSAVAANGYFITATSTATLPATPIEGDAISFIVDTTQFLTITGNTGQKIRLGTTLSGAAGTCVNNARGDSIELVYRSTGTTWFGRTSIGTWSIT